MIEAGKSEYRILDSASRVLARSESKAIIRRRTHSLVLAVTKDGVDGPFADWFYDLRRHRLRLYGGLLRFIDLSYERKVDKAMLMNIPRWIAAYIDDLFGADAPGTSAG